MQKIEFSVGDLIYKIDNNQYFVYKILVIDENETYHVLVYKPCVNLHEKEFDIFVYHSPFDKNAFKNFIIINNKKVTFDELLGYHEYLKSTQDINYIISVANNYYLSALKLAEENEFNEAIDMYSKAIDLFPHFIEAIENRGFTNMSLGLFSNAIKDFELSLSYDSDNFLAQFEIGECLYNLQKYEKAKNKFEIAKKINPHEEIVEEFLKKTNNKIELENTRLV